MPAPERLGGRDSLLLHLETPDVPMHTLKILVLDSTQRGRAVSREDIRAAVEPRLGLVPWTTRRLVERRWFGARPFLVDDADFDLDAHLGEVDLADAEPGWRDLDEVCARLAEQHLPRDRPLWALTLVHGLDGGRQAVIARVHHAVMDGLAAANLFSALTGESSGDVPPAAAAPRPSSTPGQAALAVGVLRSWGPRLRLLPVIGRERRASRRAEQPSPDDAASVPRPLRARRSSLNGRGEASRVCASSRLDLGAVRGISQATGGTVTGVLHGVLAGAVRAELLARGERVEAPLVATFGVAEDVADPRLGGNAIAETHVHLHAELSDPVARLEATARSMRVSVGQRRSAGFARTEFLAGLAPRVASRLRALAAPRSPVVLNHVTTASLRGPSEHRWLGDVEVVGFFSQSLAVAPADVNLTAYSYGGEMYLGLIGTPRTMVDPARFLRRMGEALVELDEAIRGRRGVLRGEESPSQ
ncbi:wax ester/triacylglycerol synthase domain-containing protein [Nocardioides acrostichi]|uniref:diacylglycerol O-acyltransferase n=1 Tax=Nocardioides acrostichi TaxID=2784339 RepID=A0A930V2H6_9ACTN|nr:wax ester/triacylglycerol synthase domain-containing protein [Nocardioides acrostichi]MBF4163465.1 DUF1298 domain-containing protein [Nocardioides acrostichi]